MQNRSLTHVSVWLDGSPSDGCVFPQAVDWAFRLNLPIRAVVTAPRTKRVSSRAVLPEETDQNHGPVVEKMKTWGVACAQRGIVLEMFLSLEIGSAALDQFLRPHGLCLFVENASAPVQLELLHRSAGKQDIAVLVCPPNCALINRIIILHHQTNTSGGYLETAARLCQALEIQPVILIVADTERDANLRQGYAEAVCSSFRLLADFDFVVGSDIRSAVRRVATWRSCSHLIIDRRLTPSWWQFATRDLLDHLRGLSDSLSILALPETLAFDAFQKIRGNRLNFPVGSSAEIKSKANKEFV